MEKKVETVKHQQHGVQEQCKTLRADIEKTEQENKKLEGLIKDHGEVKRQLYEAETKEMKGINKKNLAKIKSFYSKKQDDKVVSFVLDSLTKFLDGNQTATYQANGLSYFTSADDLQQNIRKVDHGCIPDKDLQEMMKKMCGGDQSDGGEIAQELSNEKNIKTYIDFFCYFKTLSKMCHLAMITHKETKAVNTLKKNLVKIEQKKSDLVQKAKLEESLNFWKGIKEECERVQQDEVGVLERKLSKI